MRFMARISIKEVSETLPCFSRTDSVVEVIASAVIALRAFLPICLQNEENLII